MYLWLRTMFTKSIKIVFITLALVLIAQSAEAQCAMCKATAESNAQGGGGIASGLNEGILWLMFFPYMLLGGVAYLWYRHNKKTKNQVANEN